jgi:dihydrofolate synthase/folylpolyglutamate synthase
VIVGTEEEEALAVIREVATAKDAPLFMPGKDFGISQRNEGTFSIKTWRRSYPELVLPLLGAHQRKNAAVAVGIAEALAERGIAKIDEEKLREALARVRLPARIELISKEPLVILDGAHDPLALAALRTVLEEIPKRRVLLFAIQGDKDFQGCLETILSPVDQAVFTTTGNPRSATPEELAKIAQEVGFREFTTEPEVEKALSKALALAEAAQGLLCITGSFYLAGEVLKVARWLR